ncbi:MAG: flagellar hook-basal body complex protein FliE [Deltaproteobacteria bacterium]|nr:MAG: flagellar hook-basal body complex protein FliE [Deltaproteobacteria bacterium]
MATPVHLASSAGSLPPVDRTAGSARAGDVDLADAFADALERASEQERTADDLATRFADGDRSVGLHEVMVATSKANVAVRFAITLKNRAIEAYRELMRTPV